MTDGDSLLKDILANPDCDTRRLAYADWLCENSRADQGDYIRLALKLRGLLCHGGVRALHTGDKLRRMLAEQPLNPGWREIWPGAKMGGVLAYTWKGMYETVFCEAATWIRNGDWAMEHWPMRRVVLHTRPEIYYGAHGACCLVEDARTSRWIWASDVTKHAESIPTHDVVHSFCCLRWKGLKFSLPPTDVTTGGVWESLPQSDVGLDFAMKTFDAAILNMIQAVNFPS